MSLLVRRNKPNIFRIGNIRIYPGVTEITDEGQIKTLTSHPAWQPMIDNGVHTIIKRESIEKKEEETSDISEMKAKDAIAIISETYSIPILNSMNEREMDDKGRATVIEAIKDQIIELKSGFKKPDDDEGDKE